jgi:hypothetical protein
MEFIMLIQTIGAARLAEMLSSEPGCRPAPVRLQAPLQRQVPPSRPRTANA